MNTSQAIKKYLRWLESKDPSPHTLRAYASDLKHWFASLPADLEVSELAPEHLSRFVEAQREHKLTTRTISRRLAALRGFSRWLIQKGLTDRTPWDFSEVTPRRQHSLPRVAHTSDLRLLHGHLQQEFRRQRSLRDTVARRPHDATTLLAVSLMLATGTRVGETTQIDCSNIDLASGSIRVRGKGNRERIVYFADGWLAQLLEEYMTLRTQLGIQHPYLLFNRRHDPISPASIRLRMKTACDAASVSRAVTPHALRHAAATHLLEAGVDIRFVQRLLGHASLSTTEIYTHVADVALKRAVVGANVLEREFPMR